ARRAVGHPPARSGLRAGPDRGRPDRGHARAGFGWGIHRVHRGRRRAGEGALHQARGHRDRHQYRSATLPRDPDRAEVACMLLLGDILRRHAAVRGDKTAYVVGADRVTYRAFHARSNQLARALARLGVGRSDRVAVMATNRTEYPVIYFAAIKLGAIVVPVNSRFTAAAVATIVGHAEAETFFVAPEFADLVGTL